MQTTGYAALPPPLFRRPQAAPHPEGRVPPVVGVLKQRHLGLLRQRKQRPLLRKRLSHQLIRHAVLRHVEEAAASRRRPHRRRGRCLGGGHVNDGDVLRGGG